MASYLKLSLIVIVNATAIAVINRLLVKWYWSYLMTTTTSHEWQQFGTNRRVGPATHLDVLEHTGENPHDTQRAMGCFMIALAAGASVAELRFPPTFLSITEPVTFNALTSKAVFLVLLWLVVMVAASRVAERLFNDREYRFVTFGGPTYYAPIRNRWCVVAGLSLLPLYFGLSYLYIPPYAHAIFGSLLLIYVLASYCLLALWERYEYDNENISVVFISILIPVLALIGGVIVLLK